MTIDAARIARDRTLAEAASPAPWAIDEGSDIDGTPFRHIDGWCDEGKSWMCLDAADAAFIAAARTLLPEYITEVERLQAENARLRQALVIIYELAVTGKADGTTTLELIEVDADDALNGGQP